MKKLVTNGVILRRTNYGEADRIITVLTIDQGKIRLLAKGVRRIKSKLAGGIEILSINNLTYLPGRRELGTLISARLVRNFGHIINDVDRTMYAYEVLKLIDKNTEDNYEEEYFNLLTTTLESINDQTIALDWIRLWVLLRLLYLGGHSPNLTTDSTGQPLNPTDRFVFSFDNMAFTAHTAGEFDARSVKLVRLASRVSSPARLVNIEGGQDLLPQLVQLARSMYSRYSHAG